MIPRKNIVSILLATIMIVSTFTFVEPSIVDASSGKTLYVGGSGPGNYTTIQSAVDRAIDGDTVFVYSGTYNENIIINKAINLTGENKSTTIIHGNSSGHVVYISADWVNLSGFTIQNSELTDAGIYLSSSSHNTISTNTITNNTDGMLLSSSSHNTISYNTITHNYRNGIVIESSSSNNIITNNIITNNTDGNGMVLSSSSNNTISTNTITNNGNGMFIFASSSNNTISTNTIANYWMGIILASSSTTISYNTITHNFKGIYLLGSNNTITENIITHNYEGIYLYYSDNNTIYHNNFNNSKHHATTYAAGVNTWDDGYPSGGNYWNEYTGIDIYHGPNQDIYGGDGIGDIPYSISGDSNQDRYPLMHPYSPSSNIYFQGLEPLYTTEYIEVAISIDPKEAIAGAQFDMSFDPSMLSADWVAEGDLFSEYDTYFNPGVIDNTNGTLKNVVSLITTPVGNTTNQGSIAIVAIRAKTIPGETPLNLSNMIVGRPDATPIKVTIINTTVTILHHDRWDVNWDDHANILDLILIGQWWGETGSPCWIPADVNCDGVINILDMVLVGQHWTG